MASTGVHAEVLGPVSGQLAVGSNIVQYHVEAGGAVNHGDPAAVPQPKLRPHIALKGRDPELLGRTHDVRAALTALGPSVPVELHGSPGSARASFSSTKADARCGGDVCSLGTLPVRAQTTVSGLLWANSSQRPKASVRSAQNDFSNGNNRVTM